MKGKNWKTTIGGIVIAAGLAMQASQDHTVNIIGIVIGAIGSVLFGASAKDNNVTGGTKQQ
jgi:hypothetical protein